MTYLINIIATIIFFIAVIMTITALFVKGNIAGVVIFGVIAFVMKVIMNATEGVSEEKIITKIDDLNSGILNSNNVPSHFTSSQCNDMGYLAMELSSYEKELRQSNLSKSNLKKISKSVNDIEKRAKAV